MTRNIDNPTNFKAKKTLSQKEIFSISILKTKFKKKLEE